MSWTGKLQRCVRCRISSATRRATMTPDQIALVQQSFAKVAPIAAAE
jgi:hypothetical protein